MTMKKLNGTKIVGMTDRAAAEILSSIKAGLRQLRTSNNESSSNLVTLWHLWPTALNQSYPDCLTNLNVSESDTGVSVDLSYKTGMDVSAHWKPDWQEADEEPFFVLDDLTVSFPKDRIPKDNLSCKFRFDGQRIAKDLLRQPRLRESAAYESY